MTNHTTNQLIELLTHPDGTQRRQAALALGTSADPAAAEALVERLSVESQSCVREDLTWATVQHIDTALPQVLAMLTSEEPGKRRTGAHVLSKVGDPEHLEHLVPLVADEHSDVAIKAYRAVANTGRPEALDALAARLGDGDSLQRDALTAAFDRFGETAVPLLVTALASEDADVREHAADVLGHVGQDADASAPVLAALAADSVPSVRLAAVSALGQLGPVAHLALEGLATGPDARVAAVARRFLAQARAKALSVSTASASPAR
ncbi:MAG: HEAT repeat domain-containing protein [Actinomycetes bacterium]